MTTKKAKKIKVIATNKPVEIVVILDQSTSMEKIKKATIDSFNDFITKQQAEPGEANLTVVLFDSVVHAPLQDRVPLKDAVFFDETNFNPQGWTAMNDAIGSTVARFNALHEAKEIGDHVIVCVLTDGEENSSKFFTDEAVKNLIIPCQSEKKWEFQFLAANQDAILNGAKRGFLAAKSIGYAACAAGMNFASDHLSASTTTYRSSVTTKTTTKTNG
jgi:uncharacterized protein YegL